METDIEQIKYLSEIREKENKKFREFLKKIKLSAKFIDRAVHEIYETVQAEIDCTQCANCCSCISPIFKNRDIDQISEFLRIKPVDFIRKYLVRDEDDDLVLKSSPCPFLESKLCTIYEVRPGDCMSYPHLDQNHFITHLGDTIKNCAICPIVYNVFEMLKEHPLFSKFDSIRDHL